MQSHGRSGWGSVRALLLLAMLAGCGGGSGGGGNDPSQSGAQSSQTGSLTGSLTPSPSTLPANGARGVPTFESIGLYWTPPSNPGADGCSVIFRKAGDASFRPALNMWFDARNNECRGSLVLLEPATTYEVQIGIAGQAASAGLSVATWSEQFPI